MVKLTFEEVQEKLDDLGIKLFDNEEWDCYDIYPQYTMRGDERLLGARALLSDIGRYVKDLLPGCPKGAKCE